MKKVCIFDFDGIIVDSMGEFAEIAARVLNKYFGTPVDEAERQYIQTSGVPFFEQLEILHNDDPKNKAAANEFEETKKKTYLMKKPFDDAKPTLHDLQARGIRTVISSNNFQELVDEFVGQLDFKFDLVLGWRKNFSKGRDHFEHAQKTTGCSLDEMIFIGDSLKDAERARSHGIDFVAKTGTFTRSDFEKHCPEAPVIESLKELKENLDKLDSEKK